MTYEEQLDAAIKELQGKLEEAFNEYDKVVNMYGSCGFNELNRIPDYVLESLINKWSPMTGHIRSQKVVQDITIRLEMFGRMIKDPKLRKIFMPIIALGANL